MIFNKKNFYKSTLIVTIELILFCIFLYFFGLMEPKALIFTGNITKDTTTIPVSSYEVRDGIFGGTYTATRNGFVIFTFSVIGQGAIRPLDELWLGNGNYWSVCDIGNTSTYFDNTSMVNTYTAKCYIQENFQFNEVKIGLLRSNQSGNYIDWSDKYTIVTDDINEHLDDVISGLRDVNLNDQQIYTLLTQIYSKLGTDSTTINNIQNNTQNINDSINDDSVDSSGASTSASTWNNKNATNGTITQLLTLPITLLQAIVNGIQTSCSSFSLGSLFGTNITLPCINLSNLIGSGLFTTIDILFSGFMILSIGKKLIKIFNDFTNLKSNQIDELYGGGK